MSTETKNHKLFKYEDNDVADLRFLHNSMETIDKGLTLDVGTSTGTGNDYVLNLGSITLSSANKGISFKFWADKDSNGAVTINGIYNLVNTNGNPIKNIKRNAPYSITYDGSTNFFLASGGVDDVNFSASDLLENKTANNSDGEKVTGTMPNVGQQTATINAGGKVVITKGYHNGTGYIQANSMSTQLNSLGVTLTGANQLVNGVKAVDRNGNVITGTATLETLDGYKVIKGTYPDNLVLDSQQKDWTIPNATKIYLFLHYDKQISKFWAIGPFSGYGTHMDLSKIGHNEDIKYRDHRVIELINDNTLRFYTPGKWTLNSEGNYYICVYR